jgi:hypothetical protein
MKIRFIGQSPHTVPGVKENVEIGEVLDVSDEKGKELLNGLFEKVDETVIPSTSANITTNTDDKEVE